MKKKHTGGFTLVELIVVIVIILILAAVLAPNVTKYIKSAREARARSEALNIINAMQYEAIPMMAQTEALGQNANHVGIGAKNGDVSWIGTDFAKSILKDAGGNPKLAIVGMGNSEKYTGDEAYKSYIVYFVAYQAKESDAPIFYNGTEWSDVYPWKKGDDGKNTFEVNGEKIDLQFYFLAGPYPNNLSADWNYLKSKITKYKT